MRRVDRSSTLGEPVTPTPAATSTPTPAPTATPSPTGTGTPVLRLSQVTFAPGTIPGCGPVFPTPFRGYTGTLYAYGCDTTPYHVSGQTGFGSLTCAGVISTDPCISPPNQHVMPLPAACPATVAPDTVGGCDLYVLVDESAAGNTFAAGAAGSSASIPWAMALPIPSMRASSLDRRALPIRSRPRCPTPEAGEEKLDDRTRAGDNFRSAS
jgi:hypothetical protein